MWATSHGRDRVFSELKEQFQGGRAPGVSGMLSLMDVSLQNPGTSNVHINVGQRCCVPVDVFVITPSNAGEGNVATHIASRQDCC